MKCFVALLVVIGVTVACKPKKSPTSETKATFASPTLSGSFTLAGGKYVEFELLGTENVYSDLQHATFFPRDEFSESYSFKPIEGPTQDENGNVLGYRFVASRNQMNRDVSVDFDLRGNLTQLCYFECLPAARITINTAPNVPIVDNAELIDNGITITSKLIPSPDSRRFYQFGVSNYQEPITGGEPWAIIMLRVFNADMKVVSTTFDSAKIERNPDFTLLSGEKELVRTAIRVAQADPSGHGMLNIAASMRLYEGDWETSGFELSTHVEPQGLLHRSELTLVQKSVGIR